MSIIRERFLQKYRTLDWPKVEPVLSSRYRGKPQLIDVKCGNCDKCLSVCPTNALIPEKPGHIPGLDMGLCIFCGACEKACPEGGIHFGKDYHIAQLSRQDLILHPQSQEDAKKEIAENDNKDKSLLLKKSRIFRKSFKLRQVSAGGCNACEADCNVLGTLVYDLGRFGVEFTASPRHADGLALTGPVTLNMLPALIDTWEAIPSPKILIAVGACAISGGLFKNSGQVTNGLDNVPDISPDIYIPGCPPNPWTILDGLLKIRP